MSEGSEKVEEKKVKVSLRSVRKKGDEFYKHLYYVHNGIKHKDIITGTTAEEVKAKEEAWLRDIKEKNELVEHKVDIPDSPFVMDVPEKGGFSVIAIGASRSGKTTALKHIVEQYMEGKILFLTSFNDHADIYKDMPKRTIISRSFHPEILKDYHILQHESKNKYKVCFIYDDAVGNELKNSKEITKLLTIYRNSDMSSIFSAQSPTLVSPAGRSNGNFILLFALNASNEIEKIVKDYLRSYFPKEMTMNERVIWYKKNMSDHNFLLIDNINGTIQRCKLSKEQI